MPLNRALLVCLALEERESPQPYLHKDSGCSRELATGFAQLSAPYLLKRYSRRTMQKMVFFVCQ